MKDHILFTNVILHSLSIINILETRKKKTNEMLKQKILLFTQAKAKKVSHFPPFFFFFTILILVFHIPRESYRSLTLRYKRKAKEKEKKK